MLAVSILVLMSAATSTAAMAAAPAKLTVVRVVMLMRHGVRPPTKDPALPAGMAPEPWPRWSVPPGWLTPHGAQAVTLLGRADRASLAADRVLPETGCPAPGMVVIASDSDERTIATGDAYIAGLAPGCGIDVRHRPQDDPDPLFHEAEQQHDSQAADHAAQEAMGPGGIALVEQRERDAIGDVDHILCGALKGGCGLPASSELIPARQGKAPKFGGALDRGSSAAQTFLLEYADGKPMSEVGWGRASAAGIERIGSLHATEFAILARPPVLAAANVAGIARSIAASLTSGKANLTVIVGHDTNVANLAGLLGAHWKIGGFAADDPSPGGALELELVRNATGQSFVRAFFRSQTLDQIRTLAPGGDTKVPIPMDRCGDRRLCPLDVFLSLLQVDA